MNQLMIELYQQALEFAYKNISKESRNTDYFHAVVSGKFGELIVKECALVVHKKIGPKTALDVLEHFGVKEDE